MKIVIPMAGHSERFFRGGYTVPKAFITIDGRPMIHWVCDIYSPDDEFVFIAQDTHLREPRFRKILESATPNYEIVEIEPHRKGPVYTSLFADDFVDDNEPVIIGYCDLYQHWNYQRFLRITQAYDGGLAVFRGFHPASFGDTFYAYIKTNERGEMLELREKQSYTDRRHEEPASGGIYYLRTWGLFKEYSQRVLEENRAVGGEYYASLIYNPMVEDGLRVITFDIDKYICWGTPEDVEEYVFWSDFFKNDALRIMNQEYRP